MTLKILTEIINEFVRQINTIIKHSIQNISKNENWIVPINYSK